MPAFYKPKGPIAPGLSEIADTLTEVLKISELAMPFIKGKRDEQARALRLVVKTARRALAQTTRLQAFIKANNIYWDDNNEGGGYIYPPEIFYAIIAQMDQWDAAVTECLEARDRFAKAVR